MYYPCHEFKPICLRMSDGWVLKWYSIHVPIIRIFESEKYPNLSIQILEQTPRFDFLEGKYKSVPQKEKTYIVSIAKRGGYHDMATRISLYEEKFRGKKMSDILKDERILNYLEFFEKKESDYLEDSKKFQNLENVYLHFEHLLRNIEHEWYSNYGCVIHSGDFPIFKGIYGCVPYDVFRTDTKTYLSFSEPVGIWK